MCLHFAENSKHPEEAAEKFKMTTFVKTTWIANQPHFSHWKKILLKKGELNHLFPPSPVCVLLFLFSSSSGMCRASCDNSTNSAPSLGDCVSLIAYYTFYDARNYLWNSGDNTILSNITMSLISLWHTYYILPWSLLHFPWNDPKIKYPIQNAANMKTHKKGPVS